MKDGLVETKEELKALFSKPSPEVKVHVNCKFCKNIYTDKCTGTPCPDTCEKYDENNNISYSEKIVMLIQEESPLFFKDQYGNARIWIRDNGLRKNFKINSDEFKNYAIDYFYRTFAKVPKNDAVKDAVRALEAITRNSKTINVRNRVTMVKGENGGDEIWIDLCDEWWRSIKITNKGHELVTESPPLFRRFAHMEALCLPKDAKDATDDGPWDFCTPPTRYFFSQKKKGGIENSCNSSTLSSESSFKYLFKIFDYLRVPDEDKILIISAMVSYFFVGYPYVCVSVNGPSGRGKSLGTKILKRLIDPSKTIILAIDRNRDQLLQDLDHHFFCVFDNVSYISDEYSDIFCRASTGYGVSKRLLYTNDSDFLRTIKRPLFFNGIPVAINREDLLKRTIITEVLPLEGKERTEQEIYAEFDKIKPFILHELYTLVSKVMAILPTIKPKKLFRMADFTRIGCAVAEVFGYEQDLFLEAYESKQNDQIREVIWNNTLGNVLYDFIEPISEWRGTPSELYKLLKLQAKELGVSTRSKDYPKAPNIMSREIKRLQESFEKIGVQIEFIKGTKREIQIINSNVAPKKCVKCGNQLSTHYYERKEGNYCPECGKSLPPKPGIPVEELFV